jgi:multidrug transporter EmrE-like cation transporter
MTWIAVTIGALAFDDRISPTTIIGIVLILTGVALLNSTGIRSS